MIKVIIQRLANKWELLNGCGLIGKLITRVLKCIQLKLTNDHPGVKTVNYGSLASLRGKDIQLQSCGCFDANLKQRKLSLLYKDS